MRCGSGTLPRPDGGYPGPLGLIRASVPAEPSFVFADVVRESPEGEDLGDDRVYFFFTEVSVEYEFVFKLMIPRIARVCKVSPPPPFSLVPALGESASPGSTLPLRCPSPTAYSSTPQTAVWMGWRARPSSFLQVTLGTTGAPARV